MPKRRAALPQSIRWTIGGIAAVVLGLAIAWALFVPAAHWLAHHDVGSVKGSPYETAVDNARGRLLTLGAGLFAAGALAFTARNFTLSRQGQVTDRYTKAITQLGSKQLDVRIGGIYALERVARDSARDHPTVMEVLTAFIREHSNKQWPRPDHPATREQEPSTRPDVQAALTVVARRDPRRDIQPIDLNRARLVPLRDPGRDIQSIDLNRAHLIGADLFRANLTRARLTGADLTDADLTDANLTDAALIDANLTRANLTRANLTRARPIDADLTGANLTRANLTNAFLTGATLTDANLFGANLTRAYLTGADLTRAVLSSTDLTGGDLTDADLTGAKLTWTDLTRADLTRADLTGADLTRAVLSSTDLTDTTLTGADLTGIRWPGGGLVPEGWRPDSGSGRLEWAGTGSRPTEAD